MAQRPVLITGGTGQIGQELARLDWPAPLAPHFPSRQQCDLADEASIRRTISERDWACVINCAAWTAVDAAETQSEDAFRANATGPAVLAEMTAGRDIPLIHLSTDYVFSGTLDRPYVEDDPTDPRCVYGQSKRAGEVAVLAAHPRAIVLRTAWVVSAHGSNFLKTMLRLGAERTDLRIVADQIGCPTSAADIAATVQTMLLRQMAGRHAPSGLYHFVNAGEASWYDLARSIFALAQPLGAPSPRVTPIPTADYPTPARRPANSRLGTRRIERDFGIVARPWVDAVAPIVREVLAARIRSGPEQMEGATR